MRHEIERILIIQEKGCGICLQMRQEEQMTY